MHKLFQTPIFSSGFSEMKLDVFTNNKLNLGVLKIVFCDHFSQKL